MHRIEAYVTLGIIFILMISILYLPFLLSQKKKGKSVIRQLAYLGLICSLFLIIFATILFTPITFTPEYRVVNFNLFEFLNQGDRRLYAEIIPNILLFIPFGLFMPIVFEKLRSVVNTMKITFVVTLCIETFQYFIGRSADIDDVIMNLVGGLLGYCLYSISNYLLKNTKFWKELINT